MMKWYDSVSQASALEAAVGECAQQIGAAAGERQFNLLLYFCSFEQGADRLPELLSHAFPGALQIGSAAGGVISRYQEIEDGPALSVLAAELPGVLLSPFYLSAQALPDPERTPTLWRNLLEGHPEDAAVLLLPDALSFDTEAFLDGLAHCCPQTVPFGGLASGPERRGARRLFLDGKCYNGGLVGVVLSGALRIETIVAQGCRPVGPPMFVTKCQGNVLQEIDCRSPKEALETLFESLEMADRRRLQSGIYLGLGMQAEGREYGRGDFVVRNIAGIDEATGFLIVGAVLQEAQVIQFHVRDAQAAAVELEDGLRQFAAGERHGIPAAVLLFTCLGRGQRLFGGSGHDSALLRRHLGSSAMGGFFCGGELGPMHGQGRLHTYTSVAAVFYAGKDENE